MGSAKEHEAKIEESLRYFGISWEEERGGFTIARNTERARKLMGLEATAPDSVAGERSRIIIDYDPGHPLIVIRVRKER